MYSVSHISLLRVNLLSLRWSSSEVLDPLSRLVWEVSGHWPAFHYTSNHIL